MGSSFHVIVFPVIFFIVPRGTDTHWDELLLQNQPHVEYSSHLRGGSENINSFPFGSTAKYANIIYYFLSDDHVRTIISKGFEHLIEERTENNEEDL